MNTKKEKNQSWGGRFNEKTDNFVAQFTASIDFDHKLAIHDIKGSLAHAEMLASIGILSSKELIAIKDGLDDIRISNRSKRILLVI
jgi:argininosuccinate lyase